MIFQASNYKGRNFLNLNDNKGENIHLICTKEGVWLKYFGLFNSLYVWIIRLITNHTLIDKYRLRFSREEPIAYLYGNYSVKTRRHILFEYQEYTKC